MSPIRILIAEVQNDQSQSIEKSLNLLGQFCICRVSSFFEFDRITSPAVVVFDLVIVNHTLTRNEGLDAAVFCLSNPCIRNALVYGDEYLILREAGPIMKWGTLMMAKTPDLLALRRVLEELKY